MGKVFLVGAGPGDPDLLTLKALRLLQRADVVLHDALVFQAIIDLVRPSARIIDVGKRSGHKLLSQEEINSLLLFFASRAGIVVRLKSGDPSIFGRTGEEIDALVRAGVQFEIVPGITSALAGAAAAGVSLTDRRYASSVVFTTAQRASGSGRTEWEKLITSGSTLVIYMPGQDYAHLSAELCSAGLPGTTPCTVVSSAGCPQQSVLWTNLDSLGHTSALPAPALVMVGHCASALTQFPMLIDHGVDEHYEPMQFDHLS